MNVEKWDSTQVLLHHGKPRIMYHTPRVSPDAINSVESRKSDVFAASQRHVKVSVHLDHFLSLTTVPINPISSIR
jgi:hypothetical protein